MPDTAWMVPGAPCVVQLDSGELMESKIKYNPWPRPGGRMVVGIEGIAGGYAVGRVLPVTLCSAVRPWRQDCPAPGCGHSLLFGQVVCSRCWKRLPRSLQLDIWLYAGPVYDYDGAFHPNIRELRQRARAWIAEGERAA